MGNTIALKFDVIDTVGTLHEGVGYVLLVSVDGENYEAAYWVHPTAEPVLVLEADLEALLEAPEGSPVHDMLLKTIGESFTREQLLNNEQE